MEWSPQRCFLHVFISRRVHNLAGVRSCPQTLTHKPEIFWSLRRRFFVFFAQQDLTRPRTSQYQFPTHSGGERQVLCAAKEMKRTNHEAPMPQTKPSPTRKSRSDRIPSIYPVDTPTHTAVPHCPGVKRDRTI